jgi:hypothetical protein
MRRRGRGEGRWMHKEEGGGGMIWYMCAPQEVSGCHQRHVQVLDFSSFAAKYIFIKQLILYFYIVLSCNERGGKSI